MPQKDNPLSQQPELVKVRQLDVQLTFAVQLREVPIEVRPKKPPSAALNGMTGQDLPTLHFVVAIIVFVVLPTIVIPMVGKIPK